MEQIGFRKVDAPQYWNIDINYIYSLIFIFRQEKKIQEKGCFF